MKTTKQGVPTKSRLIRLSRAFDRAVLSYIQQHGYPGETFAAFTRRALRNEMRRKTRSRR